MKGHTISWGEFTYPERVTGRYVLTAVIGSKGIPLEIEFDSGYHWAIGE
jgi:hypothetical protein